MPELGVLHNLHESRYLPALGLIIVSTYIVLVDS